MAEEEAGYTVVMPFLVVQSKGGPYEDEAFTAGWAMGSLDAKLEALSIDLRAAYKIGVTVPTECIPQIDLIAMKHGFICAAAATKDPTWMRAVLTRSPGESLDGS